VLNEIAYTNVQVGNSLKELRSFLGITQKELSKILNTAQSNISKIESGIYSLPSRCYFILSSKLNVDFIDGKFIFKEI
jgi:transcriptional regulator with XRE-family HTH domain